MEELVTRLKLKVGVPETTARRATQEVVSFLRREGPADAMEELAAAIPDLRLYLDGDEDEEAVPSDTRHFGGMARLMQVADRMMAAGMTMPQVQLATHEVVAFARERAGEDVVERIVRAIPGLRQVA